MWGAVKANPYQTPIARDVVQDKPKMHFSPGDVLSLSRHAILTILPAAFCMLIAPTIVAVRGASPGMAPDIDLGLTFFLL